MSRTLSADSTLETLKKEAKRWLKALRAGDARAKERFLAATGTAPDAAALGLRDVQLALAREYGFPGWIALRGALDDLTLARRSREERVEIVLRSVTWHGDQTAAARILARWPELGAHDFYIAVATGNVAEVKRRLERDPGAAGRKGGPLAREPLLYLTYSRLPGSEMNALAIANALLDHGADPNVGFTDDWETPFKVVTGVIGEGEGDQPPHPLAKELVALLFERGADPFDTQVLYNTSITRDDTTWLDILWNECARQGISDRWHSVSKALGAFASVNALDYLLGNAVAHDHIRRAEWLLTHGANPNGPHSYSRRPLREVALVYGYQGMADLLVRYGADATPLEGQAAFQAACMQLDKEAARAVLAQHPECLQNAEPMLTAARARRADIVALLLELGMNVDVADHTQQRGLHNAVMGGSLEVVKLLVAHGANIDRPTTRYGGALGFAGHFQRHEIAAFLAPLSHDDWNLTYLVIKDRLRELFAADPALVNARHPRSGVTPLFFLPDDEDAAADVTAFLLASGADPRIANNEGATAEQVARQRGLIDAADLMT